MSDSVADDPAYAQQVEGVRMAIAVLAAWTESGDGPVAETSDVGVVVRSYLAEGIALERISDGLISLAGLLLRRLAYARDRSELECLQDIAALFPG